MAKIFCVTGPMAAGKNAACSILEEMGCVSVDADILVHKAIENARDKILLTFGTEAEKKGISLLTEDGKIHRRNLGQIIFSSPELIKKQEDIVYPEVNRLIEEFLNSNKDKNCIINATVLFKVPSIKLCDFVLYIDAPKIQRYFRALKRDKMSSKQILSRFKSQKNLFAKYKFSNADIRRVWNTGSRKNLKQKLTRLLQNQLNFD